MEYISVPLSETALNEHAKNGWRLVPGSVVDRAPLDAEKPEWCAIMQRPMGADEIVSRTCTCPLPQPNSGVIKHGCPVHDTAVSS